MFKINNPLTPFNRGDRGLSSLKRVVIKKGIGLAL